METAFLIKGCLRKENFFSIPQRQCSYVLSISGELYLLTTVVERSTFLSSLMQLIGIQSINTEAELKSELVLTSMTIYSRNYKRSQRRFSIKIPGERTLYFRAPSLHEKDAWDNAICNVINFLRAENNWNDSSISTLEPLNILDDVTGSGWYKMLHDKMGFYALDDKGQWFILSIKDIDDGFELEMDIPPEVNNDEFSKVSVAINAALIAIGAAQSIPKFGIIFTFCNGVIKLFEIYKGQEGNCEKLIRTCEHMKKTLKRLDSIVKKYPSLRNEIDMDSISECEKSMEEIHRQASMHMNSGKISRFVCASSTEKLLNEALNSLKLSMSTLALSMEIIRLEETQKTAIMMEEIHKLLQQVLGDRSMIHEASIQTSQSMLCSQSFSGEAKFDSLPIEELTSLNVHHKMYSGKRSAEKVYEMDELSEEDSREIYLMFMKEVCILSQLRHANIILLHEYSSTKTESKLFFEHMEMGSLRSLLDGEEVWNTLSAVQRYLIVCDIADGMLCLHENFIAHRNLSSFNILLSRDFRAKLSGFGHSTTTYSLSTISQFTIIQNYRWLAPEGFRDKVSGEADLYSFGIVCWEILTGMLGKEKSLPWGGMSDVEVMMVVAHDKKRPALSDKCITDRNVYRANIVKSQMEQCLKDAPCDRPSFNDVFGALQLISGHRISQSEAGYK